MNYPMKTVSVILLLLVLWLPHFALGQTYSSYERELVDEHIYQGLPGYDNVFIRNAYVISYNYEHRIANWVAYHITPDYLNIPPRYGIFSSYRIDREIANPVAPHEYDSLYGRGEGLVMGHLAPFTISGGDRDRDGLYAVRDTNGDGIINQEDIRDRELSDFIDDANEVSSVYEINYLSNIVPMDYDGFIGHRGIWRELEQYIQNEVVKEQEKNVWVVAGNVLGRGEMQKIGPDKDITVPPMFFKIVVREDEQGQPLVLAFLLPHQKVPHGRLQDYLVPVDIIEAMTGLNFFRDLDDDIEAELEARDTFENWKDF